jgi:hypothetical protein
MFRAKNWVLLCVCGLLLVTQSTWAMALSRDQGDAQIFVAGVLALSICLPPVIYFFLIRTKLWDVEIRSKALTQRLEHYDRAHAAQMRALAKSIHEIRLTEELDD